MQADDTVPVSVKAPFLSNLSVIDNITLVAEVEVGSKKEQLHQKALETLNALGIENLAVQHFTALDDLHYFLVQLARASMVPQAKIVLDRPSSFAAGQKSMTFIYDALESLNIDLDRVIILELTAAEHYFKGERCDVTRWQ